VCLQDIADTLLLTLKGNPQLYWGKEKTYSCDEGNKNTKPKVI